MVDEGNKRLFFGFEAQAPWPEAVPKGRIVPEASRHLTLAFLGDIPYVPLNALLSTLPTPQFNVGLTGFTERCLYLPPHRPNVVAWSVEWLGSAGEQVSRYQNVLADFLRDHGYSIDERPFLPHITVARRPFDKAAWRKTFTALPVVASRLHLYESVGGLNYAPIWTHDLAQPFTELSHTADIAFEVVGTTMQQLAMHAFVALAFKCPESLPFRHHLPACKSLDDIVIGLNAVISACDAEVGCGLKAVSFHGDVYERPDGLLTWEMIADV